VKKHLRLILLLVLLGFNYSSFANKFVVESFKPDPANMDAQLFGRKDNSNQSCAIIKILTDIEGLSFETSKSIVGPVEIMPGEYWIYVSPGENQIKIIKEGYTTLEVNCADFKLKIESSKVYVMNLKTENAPNASPYTIDQKGDILIVTNPPGAKITIEDEPQYNGVTPLLIKQHPAGVYKITIDKEYYNIINTVFQVVPDSASKVIYPLTRNVGFIKFKVNPPSPISNIYIDGRLEQGLNEEKPFPISQGLHKLEINSKNWITQTRDVDIELGKTDSVFVDLKPILGRLIVNVSPARTEKAEVWINNKKTEYLAPGQFPVQIGDNSISLKLKGYPVYNRNFTLKKDETINMDFKLFSHDELNKQINWRRMKQNFWMASAIGFSAAGGYLITDSNKKNLEYKTAVGSDANTLHSQIDSNRKTAVAAIGIAIFSAVEFSVQIIKKEKEKHWLSIGSDGQSVGLKAKF
jgi:hypothetical protein